MRGIIDRLGAVRLPLVAAAVLTLSLGVASAQVVEQPQTWDNLNAQWPCNNGLTNRIARVMDADSTSDIGGGGGSTQVWVQCDGVDTWSIVNIGGGAGAIGGSTGSTDDAALCADGTGGATVGACTVLNLDNLRLDGNTISSTDTNGNINLDPAGTGHVVVSSGLFEMGQYGAMRYSDNRIQVRYADDSGFGNLDARVLALFNGNNLFPHLYGLVGTDAYLGLYEATFPNLRFTRNGSSGASGGHDAGVGSPAAGIVRITDGTTTGYGWTSQYGRAALSSDYTNATASMTNITSLSRTLLAGRKYTFRMVLRFSDSVAADGAVFDFDGGTATATDFGVNCQAFDTALLLSADTTALATDISITTATGASKIVCDGSFTVNAAGTFIPRAMQEAHSSGTLTIETGSHLWIEDTLFF